jgi:hypothetical protein
VRHHWLVVRRSYPHLSWIQALMLCRCKCMAQTMVRDQPAVWRKPASRKVHRHLLRFRYWICGSCRRANAHSLDFLLDRGTSLPQDPYAGMHRIMQGLTGFQASRKLHERMAFAIFRSPMSFFETTPAGRILNRFSRYVLARDPSRLFTAAVHSSPYC